MGFNTNDTKEDQLMHYLSHIQITYSGALPLGGFADPLKIIQEQQIMYRKLQLWKQCLLERHWMKGNELLVGT